MFGNNTCNNGAWKDAWSFLLENTSSSESLISPFYSSSISAYSPYVSSPFVSSAAREKNQASQAFFGADFSLSLESVGSTTSNNYSKKVFIGGIPAGTNESYCFAVFEDESSIYKLLQMCNQNNKRTMFFLQTSSTHLHPVEVKVWEVAKANFVGTLGWRKYRRFSVFVGGLPRTCSAENLTTLLEEVIGSVAYCSIEQDRVTQYPKGAACVIFSTKESYIKAIAIHEVVLRFSEGDRKVEIKPFLSRNMSCEKCGATNGTKFCSEMMCLAYYCDSCWKPVHSRGPWLSSHVPTIIKKTRNNSTSVAG